MYPMELSLDLAVVANNPQTLVCLGNHPRSLVKCMFPVSNLETLLLNFAAVGCTRSHKLQGSHWMIKNHEEVGGRWKGVWDTWYLRFRKIKNSVSYVHFSSVQSLSRVRLFATPWTHCVPDLLFLSRESRHLGVAFQAPPWSQTSSRGEAKDAALLSSRDADLLEPTEWPQGSQAFSSVWREDSGLSTLGESSREAQSGRRLLGTNGVSLWLWCCLPQPGALGP